MVLRVYQAEKGSHFSRFLTTPEQCEYLKQNGEKAVVEEFIQKSASVFSTCAQRTDRRVIKTHLPFTLAPSSLLTSGCKILYVARNIKDVMVSFYHLQRITAGRAYTGSFEEYYEFLEKDLVLYTPYWDHVEQGWKKRDLSNFYFVFYEELLEDMKSGIEKIARFLGCDLTEDELDAMVDHMRFDNFQEIMSESAERNRSAGIMNYDENNLFIRRGKVGGWRDYFSNELNNKANKWIRKNLDRIKISYPESECLV